MVGASWRMMLSPKHPGFRWLIAFSLIFATGALGFALPRLGGRLALVLLPSGLAVAVLCRWGIRVWPAVLAAGIAIDLSEHQPLLAAVGVGIGLSSAAALSWWILREGGFDGEQADDPQRCRASERYRPGERRHERVVGA